MFQVILLIISFNAAGTPEDVARQYFDLLAAKKYAEVVALYDDAEMARFKGMFHEIIVFAEGSGPEMIEGLAPLLGARSAEELKEKDPKVFFAGFLTNVMGQLGEVKFDKLEVLGHVPEGDMVHVITRTSVGVQELKMTQMEVMSMRKQDGVWKIMLSGEFEGIAQTLKGQLGM